MADEYDIAEAFRKIELELITSMRRNWQRHLDEESREGFTWSMWQAEQLKALEQYKKRNPKLFANDFAQINEKFLDQILAQKETNFFATDDRRINALANAATNDLKKAEMSLLRRANDEYRKTIYAAHAYLESVAGSIQKAVDMASNDFLEKGINSIVYKNGRRVNIADYSEMALRAASTRSRLMADGDMRKGMGIHTVKVSHYGACSETCLPWQGKVYVDDVYSGGTAAEAQKLNLPLLSTAIEGGLFHPNCRHTLITYYPGITDSGKNGNQLPYEHPPGEREHNYLQSRIQRERRLAAGSLSEEKIKEHQDKE